jgi:radical SAM superfamily enzyme YgiQ (UPF0313 family)
MIPKNIFVHMSPGDDIGYRFDTLISPNGSVATLEKIAADAGFGDACVSVDEGWPSHQETHDAIEYAIQENIQKGERPTLYFSVLLYNAERTLAYIHDLKKRFGKQIRIAIGGQLVTTSHTAYLNNEDIDYVCKGDAEVILPRLLEQTRRKGTMELYKLQEGEVTDGQYAGSSYKHFFGIQKRLDMQHTEAGIKQVCMQGAGGPGCSWAAGNKDGACNFCALTNITRMNKTPLEEALQNEKDVVEQTGATHIFDVANLFLPSLNREENKAWLKEYARLRKEYGLTTKKYVYLSIPSVDEEIAELLKEIGVVEVYLGIDHFHKDALREQNKGMYKETKDRLFPAMDALTKNGIAMRAGIVLGATTETLTTLRAVQEGVRMLIERYPGKDTLKTIGVFPVELLPGAKVWNKLKKEVTEGTAGADEIALVNKFEQYGFLTREEQTTLTQRYIERHSDVPFEHITELEREIAAMARAAGKFEHMVTAENVREAREGDQLSELRRFKGDTLQ